MRNPEAGRPLGLCGVLSRRPGADGERRLRRLCAALGRHRPGSFHQASAGPLSAGVLVAGGGGAPWCAVDGELAVVAHSRLLADGGATDAARLAAAWRRWGEETPDHLDGDFAFALWDGASRRLFAARDPAASRPFVYAEVGSDLLFASDPAALLADPAVERTPDLRALADFLVLDLYPDGRSAWAAVRKLPPGHRLSWQEGKPARVERWWRPEHVAPLSRQPDAVHAERFAALLGRVVGERLAVAAGRPAVLLSGGVDSSSVAALAADATRPGRRPLAVTHVFPSFPACDESGYARAAAAHAGLDLESVSLQRRAVPTAPQPDMADREPWTAWQLPLVAASFERLAEAGAGPVLTGCGGDSLFDAGRWAYRDDARSGRWWRLGPWLRARRRAGASWPAALAGVLVKPLLPRLWLTVLDRRRAVWHRRQVPPWLPPATVRRTGVAERLTARRLPRRFRGVRQLQLEHAVGLAQQTVALEGMEACAARCGLEVFHPLLDRRVAEHVLAVPLELAARPGPAGSKWLLRAALGARLPDVVRQRGDKTGWGPSLAHQLRGEAGRELLALFRQSRAAALGLVDDAVLRRELVRFRRGDGPYGDGLHFLPPALVELWLRAGGAGRPSEAV